nr:radical SAM protein [Methanobrevibacter filiformis]
MTFTNSINNGANSNSVNNSFNSNSLSVNTNNNHSFNCHDDFYNDIYVKRNIVEALEKQFRKSSWKREVVNVGGVTDSYQPTEKKLEIMPKILEVFIKYRNPIIISTKSDLILRDIELIDKLSKLTYVNIAGSITTFNEDIRKKIEPNTCSSMKRLNMLSRVKEETNA